MSNANESPYCLHVVGIGRSGAGYVDGLLRTGEVEDILMNPGARVAALVVDVGDADLDRAKGYADAMKTRLKELGIPPENFHFQSVSLDGAEAGSHLSRAAAKKTYNDDYNDDAGALNAALTDFAGHIGQTEMPSRIMVCFSLAGGTGSGMAVDLASHLANDKLGGNGTIIGVGQLPHSGDGDVPATLRESLDELDGLADDANPFNGGFFVTNTEHSWQRLTSYTDTGEVDLRNRIRQEVTTKFTQDAFMRLAVHNDGGALSRVLSSANGGGNWIYYNLAKFTHPGVQVLPGEPLSKWRNVICQWIDHLDDFSCVSKDFRSHCADVHLHVPREVGFDRISDKLRQRLADSFLSEGNESNVTMDFHEFFDHLTSYADICLPGLSAKDLDHYHQAGKS